MKIALMNEFSQSSKNPTILGELKKVVEPMGHTVYNTAMEAPLVPQDVPEAYTEDNPRLTYLHLGIQAALLLNSGAVDFVITGCGGNSVNLYGTVPGNCFGQNAGSCQTGNNCKPGRFQNNSSCGRSVKNWNTSFGNWGTGCRK